MMIGRVLFAVACALLQSAAPVYSQQQQNQESSVVSGGGVLESDAHQHGQEPVAAISGIRGAPAYSSIVSGLREAIPVPVAAPAGSKKLTVKVVKATDLRGEDRVGTSDVFVKLELYKDEYGPINTPLGEGKTSVIKSLAPVWNEDFLFLVPSTDDVVLKLKVLDEDLGFDDKMGECKIKLDDYRLSSTPTEVTKVIDGHRRGEDEKITVTLKLEDTMQ
mmetsp:Transcript_5525/g.12055  ORF Transcript_5525/g.12055 Transcript_5525/m.12055 type:complete len:219 (+) Transcript_5525:73-729(+)